MKNLKEKILYTILLCIITLIIIVITLFVIHNKNLKRSFNKEIYGKWIMEKSQIFDNNKVKLTNENLYDSYIIINEDNIDVCYREDNNSKCTKCNYRIEDNKIITEGERGYLADINEFSLKDELLIFKKEMNESEYVQIIFERE